MGVAQFGEQAVANLFEPVIKAAVIPFHAGIPIGQAGIGAQVQHAVAFVVHSALAQVWANLVKRGGRQAHFDLARPDGHFQRLGHGLFTRAVDRRSITSGRTISQVCRVKPTICAISAS